MKWQVAPGKRRRLEYQFQINFYFVQTKQKFQNCIISNRKVNIKTLLNINNDHKITDNFKTILGPAAVVLVEHST